MYKRRYYTLKLEKKPFEATDPAFWEDSFNDYKTQIENDTNLNVYEKEKLLALREQTLKNAREFEKMLLEVNNTIGGLFDLVRDVKKD